VSRDSLALLLGFALLASAVLGMGARRLSEPGLYYDEVIQATPASEFLRAGGEPLRIPGAENRWLFGGWFPLMTQPYMGALKSQLLIPVFAVFGASAASLRLTTLVWGCAGLGLAMLWARALFGLGVALLTGALLASDPAFLFATRHDWGSASLALVCRAGGLWLLTTGLRRDSRVLLAGGGLALGLGLYNKIDAAAFLAGGGVALLAAAPRLLAQHPRRCLAALLGLAVGAAPMALAAPSAWRAAGALARGAQRSGSDLAEKLHAWWHLLDGSYFDRLMLSGGSFEAMNQIGGAAASPFVWVFALAAVGLAAFLLRDAQRGRASRAEVFALLATVLTALTLLAMPRAARIHHVMNVLPLPQLVVALAAQRLWRARRPAARAFAAAGVAAALLGGLRVDAHTFATIHASGGRGRWSGALEAFAAGLPSGARVVSLDWGFHAPLRFVRPQLALDEPAWTLYAADLQGQPVVIEGDARTIYLVHDPDLAVFPMGAALLAALQPLPVGAVSIREHRDGAGAVAFRSIRFARPHRLVYRGTFEVTIR
jgi:hypothetical protein